MQRGYVKLHRKFLNSKVRQLKPSAICMFIDFLLMADYKTGEINTTFRELGKIMVTSHFAAIKDSLDCLEIAGVIKTKRKPNLEIKIVNWGKYQEPKSNPKMAQKCVSESETSRFGNRNKSVSESETNRFGNRNAEQISPYYITTKNKEYFLYEKISLDFQNPKTDLEKLAAYFAKGIKHPAWGKKDANKILNAALEKDLVYLQAVLDNTADLAQAKKIVARFVTNAKGHYSLFYLAQQVHSYRQELESEELK